MGYSEFQPGYLRTELNLFIDIFFNDKGIWHNFSVIYILWYNVKIKDLTIINRKIKLKTIS